MVAVHRTQSVILPEDASKGFGPTPADTREAWRSMANVGLEDDILLGREAELLADSAGRGERSDVCSTARVAWFRDLDMSHQPSRHGFRTFLVVWATQSVSVVGSALTPFASTIWLSDQLYPRPEQKSSSRWRWQR